MALWWWERIPKREGGLARDSRIPGLVFGRQPLPADPTRLPYTGTLIRPGGPSLLPVRPIGRPAGVGPALPAAPPFTSLERASVDERERPEATRTGAVAIARPFTIPRGILPAVGRLGGPAGVLVGSVLDMFIGGKKIGTLATPVQAPDTARAQTPLARLDLERRELREAGAIGAAAAVAGASEAALEFSRGIVTGLGTGKETVTVATARGIRTVSLPEVDVLAAPEGGTLVTMESGGASASVEAESAEAAGADLPRYEGPSGELGRYAE